MTESEAAAATPVPASLPAEESRDDSAKPIYLVSYPKIVFLYPTFLAAVLAGILTTLFGTKADGAPERAGEVITLLFLGILTINLVVLSFDFPRTTSLTLFFFLAMVAMGLFLLFHFKPDLLPIAGSLFNSLKPFSNSHFYFLFAGVLFIFYVMVMIYVRFDYWEVRPNELLNHHGYLSDLKRHPAPNIRIDKEISDVFEYLLLRSGRLIIHPTLEPRAIVLENVLFIDKKEQQLTKMLGSLQVQVAERRREP